jgi:hypothetical protein
LSWVDGASVNVVTKRHAKVVLTHVLLARCLKLRHLALTKNLCESVLGRLDVTFNVPVGGGDEWSDVTWGGVESGE